MDRYLYESIVREVNWLTEINPTGNRCVDLFRHLISNPYVIYNFRTGKEEMLGCYKHYIWKCLMVELTMSVTKQQKPVN